MLKKITISLIHLIIKFLYKELLFDSLDWKDIKLLEELRIHISKWKTAPHF